MPAAGILPDLAHRPRRARRPARRPGDGAGVRRAVDPREPGAQGRTTVVGRPGGRVRPSWTACSSPPPSSSSPSSSPSSPGAAGPTRRRSPAGRVPTQLDRADFDRPDAPWLVAVFTSATCDTCADVVAKAEVLASDDVAVDHVEWQTRRGPPRALPHRRRAAARDRRSPTASCGAASPVRCRRPTSGRPSPRPASAAVVTPTRLRAAARRRPRSACGTRGGRPGWVQGHAS